MLQTPAGPQYLSALGRCALGASARPQAKWEALRPGPAMPGWRAPRLLALRPPHRRGQQHSPEQERRAALARLLQVLEQQQAQAWGPFPGAAAQWGLVCRSWCGKEATVGRWRLQKQPMLQRDGSRCLPGVRQQYGVKQLLYNKWRSNQACKGRIDAVTPVCTALHTRHQTLPCRRPLWEPKKPATVLLPQVSVSRAALKLPSAPSTSVATWMPSAPTSLGPGCETGHPPLRMKHRAMQSLQQPVCAMALRRQ
jgi:hypothetical protein